MDFGDNREFVISSGFEEGEESENNLRSISLIC